MKITSLGPKLTKPQITLRSVSADFNSQSHLVDNQTCCNGIDLQ